MKLRALILHNFRLKWISLLMATLIWVAIHLATKRENGAPIPRSSAPTNEIAR